MQCKTCEGKRFVRLEVDGNEAVKKRPSWQGAAVTFDMRTRKYVLEKPCPDCVDGTAHCCDGICEQPGKQP